MKIKEKITTIDSLFDVEYGQKEYHNKEWLEGNEGSNILISSKGDDNGIYGFFNIKNKYTANFITVPSTGTIGHAFLQNKDCSVDDNCLVLIPKIKIDVELLYQIIYQIRLNKWKYKYGRQITPKRIKSQKIRLINNSIKYTDFIKKITPKKKKKIKISENKNIRLVKLIDLCDLERKYSLYLNQVGKAKEKTPYITTTEKNNGVALFCSENPNFKGKSLTIALDGKCGETFFQFDDFISGEKTAVAVLKNEYNPYLLFYIGFQIKYESWRFHYGRKLSMARLKQFKIPMPFKNKTELDLDYIERIVKNSYGFNELKQYL